MSSGSSTLDPDRWTKSSKDTVLTTRTDRTGLDDYRGVPVPKMADDRKRGES